MNDGGIAVDEDVWELVGIAPEAREAARIAARRANQSLGSWLTNAIMHAAAAELRGGGRAPDGTLPAPVGVGKLMETMRELSDRIDDAERRAANVLAPMGQRLIKLEEELATVRAAAAPPTAHLERAIARLSERLDAMGGGDGDGGRRGFWPRRDRAEG
jgi:localization factor PodJL